ncbi:MAG: AAA family ATPase [Ferrovibrio sp.]|uniref:AAA family ATPase n=1 Tax=Ferrovibrio sp. TaxID=1917215 RepID=UPI002622E72E|nr:AAA family ATPase [Ferrovibrio sp.]MCW0235407.1 AAA family ATPase [Ferrovibrio sp.]
MLTAPFLKRITLDPSKTDREAFPFGALAYLTDDFELNFETAITVIVGENGSGKSTLIEAIAQAAGFSPQGGSQDHQTGAAETANALTRALRLSWLPKVSRGFFFRAESFFNFQTYIDTAYVESGFPAPGMHRRSHGEAFLQAFEDRLHAHQRAIYILDEPEVALSPQRQLAFLRILRQWQVSGQVQAIIATHSPILMNLPEVTLLSLDGGAIRPIAPAETEHVRIMRGFLADPDGYMRDLFEDIG